MAFKVMTWNVENLFRPGAPSGPKTQAIYDEKLDGLAPVINAEAPHALRRRSLGLGRSPGGPARGARTGLRGRRDRFGEMGPEVARSVALRHDWGPQYTSSHFTWSLRWLGIEGSPACVGEPPCNGCAERSVRTFREQCIWSRHWREVDELAEGNRSFVEPYNTWLIERNGHRTPRGAHLAATSEAAA